MKNPNNTKHIARIMVLILLLSSTINLVGCEKIFVYQTEPTTNNNIHHEPEDLINSMLAKMEAAGYEEMKATAEFFFQAASISSIYDYSVEIVDGKIFLHKHIFDDISYVNDHQVIYTDTILTTALKWDKEKYDVLVKIQNHKGCYILKPQEDNAIAFKIAVYEIDNSYYFLEYYYDCVEVMKIHKVTID